MKILWSVLPLLVVLLSTSVAGQTDSTTPITGDTGATTLQDTTDASTSGDQATSTQGVAQQTESATATQSVGDQATSTQGVAQQTESATATQSVGDQATSTQGVAQQTESATATQSVGDQATSTQGVAQQTESATATQSVEEQATATQEMTEMPSDSDSYSYSYSYVAPSGLVRCYTCKDVLTNEECNGVDLGENGTLQECSQEMPNCKIELKMNPSATGWMYRKGCVDFNDCYDNMYDSLLAVENAHCLGEAWSGRNTSLPLLGSTWCYFCCSATNKDKCNYDNYIRKITFPEKNEWDPKMQWDFTMSEDEGDAAEHLKPMLLLTLAIFTVTSLIL